MEYGLCYMVYVHHRFGGQCAICLEGSLTHS